LEIRSAGEYHPQPNESDARIANINQQPALVSGQYERFETKRLAGLRAKYRGQPATVRTPAMEARILAKTRQRPPDGRTHWSTRKLAKALSISHVLVARVWRRTGLQPHRFERYMASDDPDFEQKAADVLGCICGRRSTRSSLPPTRRRRFTRWIAWIPYCPLAGTRRTPRL
jgi:homeodomain-containing protein